MRVHEIVDPYRDQNQDEDENESEVDASQSARGRVMQAHFKAPSEAVFQIVPILSPVEYFLTFMGFLTEYKTRNHCQPFKLGHCGNQ